MKTARPERRRTARLAIALKPSELERIKEAAELRGQWTATFARDSILAACDKVEKASARRARGDK